MVSKARELVSLCFRARRDLLTLITKMTLAAREYGERLPDNADRELHRMGTSHTVSRPSRCGWSSRASAGRLPQVGHADDFGGAGHRDRLAQR